MTNYKEVFQLAQDKGYKFYHEELTNNNSTDLFLELTLIQKWLRDEHDLDVLIDIDISKEYFICIKNKTLESIKGLLYESDATFSKYEQALLEGIHEALKLIKLKRG